MVSWYLDMARRNKDKQKQKKSKARIFKLGTKGEQNAVFFSLTLAFIVLVILVIILSRSLTDAARLRLENSVERNFNNILFDLQQGEISSATILADRSVLGVAIYDTSGNVLKSWGRIYSIMPLSSFAADLAVSGGNGVMHYNPSTKVMEYMRYMRTPSIIMNNPRNGNAVDFSSVMYIAFDGSQYTSRLTLLFIWSLLAIAGIALLFFFVVRIYRENRRYKEQMVKQESLVNLGQAARTLTHEIKNPLSAITIQIALLKRQLQGSYTEELSLIEHEVQRLIQLTNRVSDFLKNPEGQPEQIDMAELVESLLPLFSYEITILPSSEKHAFILFDPERLRSVLENLLKNAVESCEGRDPKVEVEIVLGRKNMYHVFIRDRGNGIKKGDVEKLFDPFFTTKIHGSGIGLSISRQFLRARGGDIKLYPRDGGGTVVEVIIARYSLVQELITQGPALRKNISGILDKEKRNEGPDSR